MNKYMNKDKRCRLKRTSNYTFINNKKKGNIHPSPLKKKSNKKNTLHYTLANNRKEVEEKQHLLANIITNYLLSQKKKNITGKHVVQRGQRKGGGGWTRGKTGESDGN